MNKDEHQATAEDLKEIRRLLWRIYDRMQPHYRKSHPVLMRVWRLLYLGSKLDQLRCRLDALFCREHHNADISPYYGHDWK